MKGTCNRIHYYNHQTDNPHNMWPDVWVGDLLGGIISAEGLH